MSLHSALLHSPPVRLSPRRQLSILGALALIVLLPFVNVSSLTGALLAASVLTMATIGGILALRLTGTPLGVSAGELLLEPAE